MERTNGENKERSFYNSFTLSNEYPVNKGH